MDREYRMPDYVGERSLGELLSNLADETRLLAKMEIELAKTEMSRKVSHYAKGGGMIAAGGVLAFVAFQVLVATAIIALNYVLPLWASALIVFAVLGIVAFVLYRRGMSALKEEPLKPEHTIESLKEDKEWAQSQMR